jgi:hypothetical protein
MRLLRGTEQEVIDLHRNNRERVGYGQGYGPNEYFPNGSSHRNTNFGSSYNAYGYDTWNTESDYHGQGFGNYGEAWYGGSGSGDSNYGYRAGGYNGIGHGSGYGFGNYGNWVYNPDKETVFGGGYGCYGDERTMLYNVIKYCIINADDIDTNCFLHAGMEKLQP